MAFMTMGTPLDTPTGPGADDLYAEARRRMVDDQLERRGVNDPRVLEVIGRVPRERFVLPSSLSEAYEDRAMQVACGQTISQPYMVGLMTQLLQAHPEHRVLEIGTGTGYQTAILAALCRAVYTIERVPELSRTADARLAELGVANVHYLIGDGTLGWADEAPFDGIMVTAGAPSVPPALPRQLADGGRLVVPVGNESYQTLTVIERHGETTVERPNIACRFVPLIGQGGWSPDETPERW